MGDLARDTLREIEEAVAAVTGLRDEVDATRGVEVVLGDWVERAEDSPHYRKQVNAVRFYLQHLISEVTDYALRHSGGQTNYVSVVNRIERWREDEARRRGEAVKVTYVTFNYDSLLEEALRRSSILTINGLPDYINSPTTAVIKPHGSADWWHPVSIETSSTGGDPKAIRQLVVANTDLGLESREITYSRTRVPVPGSAHIPALAVPVTRKTEEFECPPEHIRRLEDDLETVDRILAVGWRAQEEAFLNLLAARIPYLTQLTIVTNSDASARVVADRISRVKETRNPPLVRTGDHFVRVAPVIGGPGFTAFRQQRAWPILDS